MNIYVRLGGLGLQFVDPGDHEDVERVLCNLECRLPRSAIIDGGIDCAV
jgi:hypothetical protein